MMALIAISIWLLATCFAWLAGYYTARAETTRALVVALREGLSARGLLLAPGERSAGYTDAHGDIIEVLRTIPRARWWHAFRRGRVTPTLPTPRANGGRRVPAHLS